MFKAIQEIHINDKCVIEIVQYMKDWILEHFWNVHAIVKFMHCKPSHTNHIMNGCTVFIQPIFTLLL